MQRKFITILTLLLIGAGVWFAAPNGRREIAAGAATPEEAIQAMLDASRRSDATAYLGCFSGEMRSRLEATRQQMGAERFREYLADSQAPVLGVVMARLPEARPNRARCEVEWVLRDKNQRQAVDLTHQNGTWRIEAMSPASYVKPVIPYGTKIFAEPESTAKTGREPQPSGPAAASQ